MNQRQLVKKVKETLRSSVFSSYTNTDIIRLVKGEMRAWDERKKIESAAKFNYFANLDRLLKQFFSKR